MSFGFSIGDFIQVSNLAFKLYRRCREFPKVFADLSHEVASLRLIVDDIRMTIKENDHGLDENKTETLIHIGQGCLDCLLELESLLEKYQNLGMKARRSFSRLGWDETQISVIRQRVIANTTLLSNFNINLARSSTTRIELLLKGLVEDFKAGRHEGSMISIETIKSVQEGNEDAWDEIRLELKESGITEEEIGENKQFIASYIIEAIQSHRDDLGSLDAASFFTAAEGPNSLLSGQTLISDRSYTYDFPGVEFRATKDLVHSVDLLYKGAPDKFNAIKDSVKDVLSTFREVEYSAGDTNSLYYHERLSRKSQMIPILSQLEECLRKLQKAVGKFQEPINDNEPSGSWNSCSPSFEEAQLASECMVKHSVELSSLFQGLGTLVLCNLDDRITQILHETKDRQRSSSILYDWDELEMELIDNELISTEDVQQHKGAIISFMKQLVEDKEDAERMYHTVSNADTLEESSHSKSNILTGQSGIIARKPESPASESGQSISSLTGSIVEPNLNGVGLSARPKRISVLFVDWDNTVRSPMSQCYLEHLMAVHPFLTHCFSRVLSSGLSASKPGVPLPPGVDYMLRDYGVSHNFKHVSRRLEKRDIEKFEFVLAMNVAHVQEILHTWPPAKLLENMPDKSMEALQSKLSNSRENVRLLGSFGSSGQREVAIPEAIDHKYWFQVGTRRIYPGYDAAFNDIRALVANFVLEMTGYNINAAAAASGDEIESREVSQNVSEDEDYSNVLRNSMQVPWDPGCETSPFEELSQTISQFQISSASGIGDPFDADQKLPGPDSALSVMIRTEQQRPETDEELMHKYHEQFNKLTELLSTDIGDHSTQSLRYMVLEWQDDSSRSLLTVSTGRVKWVLQKQFSEGPDACSLCLAGNKRSGLVLDHNLEVISRTEAALIADYLTLAIHQSQNETSTEVAAKLENIRDNPVARKTAPSIRDDVSVSVRNDKPNLAYNIENLRRKDAEYKFIRANTSPVVTEKKNEDTKRPSLTRRMAQNSSHLEDRHISTSCSDSEAPEIPIKPVKTLTLELENVSSSVKQKQATREKLAVPAVTKPPVSVLFLSSTHMHLAVMAEVYLISLVDRNLALATRVCDVVSAGVRKTTPEHRFNPKKLERLFKSQGIFDCWTRKPERLLLPEDVVDFNYILTIDNVDHEGPYLSWADENPEEHEDLIAKYPKNDEAWKKNFKSRIIELNTYSVAADEKAMPLKDPVQLGEKNVLGVRHAKFEEAYNQVKMAIDQFVLLELKWDVQRRRLVKNGKERKNLVQT